MELVIPNVLMQVKVDVETTLKEIGAPPMSDEVKTMLEGQIIELIKPDHKIRYLVSE